ncbi:uncharacterized protein EAF01_010149 [Botrytis porri]|uniref:uncharacterized protein n=1 Tax=Botrytis porri TaxID=87229 RepID=UPI001902A185|nr:uncharacterized protein EAF01_010149 [Botrytis porri]KAF7894699.1 hypothetical protein EAF01_010149 [Botrytis porri]
MRSLDAAPLRENSDTIVDLSGFDSVVQSFSCKSGVSTKLNRNDKKFLALRYNKPSTLPVPSTVFLIPTAITFNKPTIEKQDLTIGTCIYLTKDASIEPGFTCFAISAQ